MEVIKKPTAVICLSHYDGGMEIDSIKLAKKLSNYTKVILIAKENCFIASKKSEYEGYNDIALETISFYKSFSLNIIIQVRKIIKQYGIKNVVFFGASELKSLYFSFLFLDINLIIRHGTTKSTPKKDYFHQLIYSDVNYHISICKHLENNVFKIIPFGKKSKSKLIHSSLPLHAPKHQQQDKLSLLHVGRIAEGKGQVDAIQACEVLFENNIDFEFKIVGGLTERYKNEFLKIYNNCPYKDKITLVGFTNDVSKYLTDTDIFLFPSHGEGLGNSFIEALSQNIICLSYNNTSFPELASLGLYFKMAKNKDIADLKLHLLDIAQNLKYEKEKSSQNYSTSQKLFSLDKEMAKYLEVLV